MRAEYLFQPRGGTGGAGPRSRSIGLRNTLDKHINTHLTRRGEDCACFVSTPERPQDTMENQDNHEQTVMHPKYLTVLLT